MRRKIQTILKGLLGAAFMACTVLSCDNEKPELVIPDVPVIDPTPDPVDENLSINIASNPISAYESGGEATVILRTTPWNILEADTNAVLTLTDTLGGRIGNVSLQSTVLMPDSTWAAKVKVTDDAGSSFIAFALALKDTTLQTSAVELKKVLSNEFKIRSIKASDALQALDFSSSTNQYTYDMPLTVINDCSAIKLRFYYDGDKITVGDSTILKSVTPYILDLTKPLNITLWKYDLRKDYTVVAKMTGTGLPIVRITASRSYNDAVKIMRRDTWQPDNNNITSISMRIELPDGTVDYEGTINLKGHGNQTWSDFDKKPFAIKLDSKAKILGMHKQKRWILLANVKDRTLLRNDISFWISRQTEMAYTINGEFVELVWNGQHLGNYYLCEQARIDNNRIDIHDPNLEDPEKGGIFMKIDAFLGYSDPKWADKETPFGFRSSRYNLPYVFKDPDEDENGDPLTESSPVYRYMYDYVTKMETAISKASATNHDWMNYLDMSSAVDYALIQEITMNHDAYNNWPGQGGPKSHNLYKDSCGVICFGPMWDYDYHTYTLYNDYEYSNQSWSSAENPRLKQWEILSMTNKNGKFYYSDLRKDPQFKALLLQRWNEYKVKWADGFNDYVDQMAEKIRVSESLNKAIWGYPSKQNGDWNLTFDKAVQAIKTAFQKRMEWIDNNIGNL